MAREFAIGNRIITEGSPPYVIGEIGNNHQGRVDLCKHLITAAKRAGCDAVKLQKRHCQSLFTKKLYDSPYENDNSFGKTYGEHKEALDFNEDQWFELIKHAKSEGIFIFSTAFDVFSIDFLVKMGIKAFKVASGDLQNIPLMVHMAKYHLPVIISTGGGSWADLDRVHATMELFEAEWCFLHCVASYPNRPEEMNLRAIPAMMERYPDTIIGLSDHYPGSLMALTAYGLGAQVFERHFTKDKTWKGPDHNLSCEPWEMEMMIHDMARVRAAMGTPEKRRQECEARGLYKMGKSIYAARHIEVGRTISLGDICIKSPAEGLSPAEWWNVIGAVARRDVGVDEAITREVIDESI